VCVWGKLVISNITCLVGADFELKLTRFVRRSGCLASRVDAGVRRMVPGHVLTLKLLS
jgi:hypothetical protein